MKTSHVSTINLQFVVTASVVHFLDYCLAGVQNLLTSVAVPKSGDFAMS